MGFRSRSFARCAVLAGVTAGLAWSSAAFAGGTQDAQPRIFGGEDASTCQWPTTVLLTSNGSLCSGVLIHPELVVTAAHCIDPESPPHDVKFGELHFEPERKVVIDKCERSPNYNGEVGGTDIGYCRLAEPVTDIPITPAIYGCETSVVQFGWPMLIAGFGRPDNDTQAGTKRWSETMIQSAVPDDATTVLIGEPGSSACNGDSGGPAYVKFPEPFNTHHAVAIVSGGVPGCGFSARIYVLIHPWIPWMEVATGLDLTPCFDRDGTWNPSDRCGRFALDPLQDEVEWGDWCASGLSAANSTCGDPFEGELADPEPPPELPPEGCGCDSPGGTDPYWWALAVLPMLLRRRGRG